MKSIPFCVLVVLAGLAGGCTAGTSPPAHEPVPPAASESPSPLGNPFGEPRAGFGVPLLIDRTDMRLGTTVHFTRVPSRQELYDLSNYVGLAHVVIALPQWPSAYANLEELDHVPEEADLIVILPGYPPTREAAQAWNLVHARVRLIVVVRTPPPNNAVVQDLNTLAALERVIAEMDPPDRRGFELLQRPLSFRVVRE
jgi:hypothetical protein